MVAEHGNLPLGQGSGRGHVRPRRSSPATKIAVWQARVKGGGRATNRGISTIPGGVGNRYNYGPCSRGELERRGGGR